MERVVTPAAITIGGRQVGGGAPCFIIAEAGVNHNGDAGLARQLVDAAADAGADAVKFQTFTADAVISHDAPKAEYQKRTTESGESQYEMLRRLELSAESERQVADYSTRRGILFLSTPYDSTSVERLMQLNVPAIKIASTDTTNLPFLRYVAAFRKPVLLSTGMCTHGEVREAVAACRTVPDLPLALLQCTSEYPAPEGDANLRVIAAFAAEFGVPVGFSDHSPGIRLATWAVASGATILEKHLTLSRSLPGPDHAASIEPGELHELVRTVREVEVALGDGVKRVMPSEARNKPVMQKSVVAARFLTAGHRLAREDLHVRRPGTGLAPGRLDSVIGRRLARELQPGEPLTAADILE
jgi:N,N'-diacetyllegionaminate synthase